MNNLKTGDGSQWVYKVEVQQRGSLIAFYTLEAPDALSAINRVELLYGTPVVVERTIIEDEEGESHRIILARNWHGYMFQARVIKPTIEQQLEPGEEPLTAVRV